MEVPNNLRVFHRSDAVEFLKGQKRGSFDELHAHIVLTNMPYEERRKLYAHAWRTLDYGGRFKIVDGAYMRRQIPLELRQHGFEVSTRRIGDDEFGAIGTGMADLAVRQSHQVRDYIRTVSQMSPSDFSLFAGTHPLKPKSPEDLIEKKKAESKEKFRRFLEAANAGQLTRDARRSIRVITADTDHEFTDKPMCSSPPGSRR